MSGTYTQLYIHCVFAVKGRENLISPKWKEDLYKYISGIIKGKEQKPIIVNGMPDHVHILIGLSPTMPVSDIVRDIKNNSSKFINERRFIQGKFQWQSGYGAFSYSYSQLNNIYQYILRQEEHHKKHTFKEEYLAFLKKYEVEYNEKFLFEFYNEEI
jgi:putative transposase